jgi:tRNA pseudouridine38-40 synthase
LKSEAEGITVEGPEIAGEKEERKAKRKVAVMIGYAGTGYKGLQLNDNGKSIEGDLFKAFVAAGAISKANSDDPKKSSLVRCARTDKGVHAAGNVLSLKLIVEEPNIVETINANLPDQIRVWGIERTNNSFSCYQRVDSRVYEYMIPTYCFLPPHPQSYLSKKLKEEAAKANDTECYNSRQAEVEGFWERVDKNEISKILDTLDSETRAGVLQALNHEQSQEDLNLRIRSKSPEPGLKVETMSEAKYELTAAIEEPVDEPKKNTHPAIKEIKAVYLRHKKAYRLPAARLERVRTAFESYVGTLNFHNYTVSKSFRDPSAKRNIKSFTVSEPMMVNDTEWLSLKVHGQSFMMHQIRKMVGMATMSVRCGSSLDIIKESFDAATIAIPKAPGLGLLLERPVFDTYNSKAETDYKRGKIDFDAHKEKIDKFKEKEIYQHIYAEEERDSM